MHLAEVSKILGATWRANFGRPMPDLEFGLFDAMRNLDYDTNRAPISALLATPLLSTGTISSSTLHIILGLYSNVSFDCSIDIGGLTIGRKYKISPFTFIPILDGWPVVNPTYHEIKINNVPKDAKIWVLGVRVKKELLNTFTESCIPGLLINKNGCVYPIQDIGDESCIQNENKWARFIGPM
jgi:hypothetical protein